MRPSVAWLAERIREAHGDGVLGVLFYGSCLRKQTDDGVLDFWIVVEDYASAYAGQGLGGRARALANRIAPPNVHYRELEREGVVLRTKYGIIDRHDFARATSLAARHPYVWARFAQPARLIACRDDEARRFFEHAVAEAVVTMVGRLVCFQPGHGDQVRFSMAAFWREAFRRTYDCERRPESEQAIESLYLADEARYDAVARLALEILAQRGRLGAVSQRPRAAEIELAPRARRLQRLRWRAMRPLARAIGLVRLFKTAWTFGDWVPYALWKLERHTGRRIETTERQRRHPFVFGWPIILPLLFKRNLR